jgi:hypothetical protein
VLLPAADVKVFNNGSQDGKAFVVMSLQASSSRDSIPWVNSLVLSAK